jgi:hypothetical protein
MHATQPEVAADAVTPAATLRSAADYLVRHGWWQGDLYADPDQPTPAACALGAIRMAVLGTPEVTADRRPRLLAVFDQAVGVFADHLVDSYGVEPATVRSEAVFTGDLEQVISRWNDDTHRNASHVIAALGGAANQWDRTHPEGGGGA